VLKERAVDRLDSSDAALAAEARLFGRYLVGREPGEAVVARYVAACRTHFAEPPRADDAAALAWVRRHGWSVAMLDAASGLLRPGGALRNRILLMAALLESTPEFADDFLPRHVGPLALAVRVGAAGAVAVANAILGAILLKTVARRA
jgi:hypothetical protein